MSGKGLKVLRSAVARRWRMGPPLWPPSFQRSRGSGVCRERLCDVPGLLCLGCPAVLCPIPGFLSLYLRLCSPVPHDTLVSYDGFRPTAQGFLLNMRYIVCSFLSLGVNFSSHLQTLGITHPPLTIITNNKNSSIGFAGLLLC